MHETVVIALTLVAIALIAGISVNAIVQKVFDFKREKLALRGPDAGGAKASQLAERTAHIEDRLAVLERIATDRGQMLADEIEALRLAHGSTDRERAQ